MSDVVTAPMKNATEPSGVPDVVEMLEALCRRARAGEVKAIAYVAITDGKRINGRTGPATDAMTAAVSDLLHSLSVEREEMYEEQP
jgi:hypothetical protein